MADKSVFTRLKRLFSTDVIIRNQGGNNIRVIDVNHIQTTGEIETNSLQDRFNRIYSSTNPSSLYGAQFNLNYQYLRTQMYSEYDVMDTDAIIASALDIIADESTLKNEQGEVLQIVSSDEDVQKILYNLFYDVLNIEFNMWSWVRQMCKYGDFFLKLEIADKFGVYNIIPYTAYHIERQEGYDKASPASIRYAFSPDGFAGGSYGYYNLPNQPTNSNRIYFDNYEMAHFRLISDVNYLPYGRCLHPKSKIYTVNSIKEIKDIVKGDKVWTFNIEENKYELANVLNTINNGIKKLYKVSTQNNEILATSNHPILMWDFEQNKPDYKQVKDIKVGDYVCSYKKAEIKLSNPKLNKNIFKLGPHDWKCDLNSLDTFPEIVTPEFARFWGFMLGDGWETSQGNQIGFSRGINDERNEYYENLLKKYSGKEKLHLIHSKTSKVKNSGVVVHSKIFHELMSINGYIGKSYSKRLPSWIYECDEETQLSLVKGIMDADGYIFNDKWNCNSYNLTLNNKELLGDLKVLLDRLKIKTGTIRSRKWTGKCNILGKEYNARQSYDFTFYLDGKRKQQPTKFNSINSQYNVELHKVKYIVEDLPEETYDIQVDVNSNFISDGIIVHNSYIEPARKLYKQYSLMEDSMLIHRIVRAPEKRVFYINIGGIPPNEVEAFMQKTISAMKRTPYIDPETGEYNLKYNMQNMMEDFYIPVRGNDATTKIDTTKGLEYDGIKDVEYLRDKMFAALKVPKAFMGYEKDLTGKATLAAEDIRFARTIDRIQRIILSELEKIALIHLYTQGYDGEQLTNFKLSLTTPSIIYDQERLALLKEKVDLAVTIFENDVLPSDWVYTNVFHLSESEFGEMRDLNVEDAKRRFRLKQISEEGNDPLETGKSYGTPHDLATLYGTGRYDNTDDVPAGYNEKATLGRPVEKSSNINTQGNAFGRDRLGVAAMKKDDQPSFGKTNYKGGSPLALEGTKKSYFQNRKLLENMKVERKVMIFESDKNKESLLDDSQLLP
jgi:intein/homing endonuclease